MTVPTSPLIRVMLVDDHTMVRRGLATFLKVFDDLELAGEAASGEAAIQLCAQVRPDVVLMDMVMPGMDGVTATQAIRRQFPGVQVIALTSFKDKSLVEEALQAGAIGYLLKNVSADELAKAIRAAYAGRPTLAPEAAEALKVTATDNLQLGIIDKIIPEPPSGAHTDPPEAARMIKEVIQDTLKELASKPKDQLLIERLAKYRAMGEFED